MKWLALLLVSLAAAGAQSIQLSDAQALEIGRRIWKNECAGTVDGLTSWNGGEAFASLGIGHFIWYPTARKGIYEESFPKLVVYFQQRGVKLPSWLTPDALCPWPNRAAFQKDFQSPQMRALRELLARTVPLQAEFAALRLEAALPKMLQRAPAGEREKIRKNFYRVAAEPLGLYALMDYVNFKGEGTSPEERYRGQGWGLLQVLEGMGNGPALKEFAASADRALTRRVGNAPPERKEARWLPGWRNRLKTYVD
ncbi:MAG TPA: hypothetical protein VIS74_07545 [Chthoniobacterales bacterium]